jgi:hypothetical protein
MVKTPSNLNNFNGRVREEIEEHLYRLQMMSRHGHTPDEVEKQRMIQAGLLKPDGSDDHE